MLASVTSTWADVVTASWNFNPEPDVSGYILCYGLTQGGPYTTQQDVGNVAIKQITLTPGFKYYFVVKAYNTSGGVSAPSNEVLVNLENQAPTLNTVANQNNLEGASVSLQLVGSDPEGSPLTYSATGLPPGVTVSASTGLITGLLGFTSSGTYSVTATVSDGIATASRSFTWTVTNRAPGVTVANDFDGDLRSDYSVFQGAGTASAAWFILRSGSNNTLNFNVPVGTLATDQPVPGDYDGDGRTDVAYFSSGTWNIKTSASNYASIVTYTLGSSTDRVAPGDYDGDGKTDPAVFHPSTGQFEILTSGSAFTVHQFITHGAATDRPVPGDYDGDGRTDAAVYKSSGQWSVLLSASATILNVTPGLAGDIPVPGDYDGDGKTDIAVYRPGATGSWIVMKSSTGFVGTTTYLIGVAGDVPVPGDYDGDRRTDVAVCHPATGVWTVLTSGSNFVNTLPPVTLGVGGDRPIPGIVIYTGLNHAPILVNPGAQPFATSEAYAQLVLGDSPVSYWRLGETIGTTAADVAGANPGALTGGVTIGLPGIFGDNAAMAFNGLDGTKINIPNSASLTAINGTSTIAMEAWVNPQASTVPSHYQIFYSFTGNAASYLALYDGGGLLKPLVALVINGVQRSFVAGPPLAVGTWYHIVATYDGAALVLYVNGAAVGQLNGLSGPLTLGTSGMQLGGYPLAGGFGFNGLLDEPAIYNHSLTAAQVAAHYAQRTYAHAVLADGPVGYWRLGETSGITAADRAGTNTGSLLGSVSLGQPGALADGNTSMRVTGGDGTNITVPNTSALAALNGSSALTMEGWINPQTLSLPSNFRIFYSFPGQPGSYLGLFDGGSGVVKIVVALVINGVQRSFIGGPALNAGSWYHVAATYDGATLTLYVNGTAVGQMTGLSGPVNVGGSGLLLGGYSITGSNYSFDGLIDEVAIYGLALSPARIATHYALRSLVPPAAVSLRLTASDPDGDILTYSASGLPLGISIDPATGRISGTLTPASVGTYSVTVTVSDGAFSSSQSFTWTVTNTNAAPVLINPGNQPSGSSEAYAQAVLGDSPLSYWRLGETTGTSAVDRTNTNHGTLLGNVTLGHSGAFGDNAAMAFSGTDGVKILVPDSPALLAIDGTSAVAMEAWVNPQALTVPTHYQIFYSFPGSSGNYLGLFDSGGSLKTVVALVINGVQRSFMAGPSLAVGTWYHIVATYNGAALVLYVNGTAVGQLTGLSGPVNLGNGGVNLGGYPLSGGFGFNGVLDEPAIYSHSLSAAQVSAHFAQHTYVQAVLADGAVGYWRVGEPSGSSAADRAGTNTGTFLGTVSFGQAGALADGNTAVRFDGVDGTNVTVSNSSTLAALNGSSALTMEGWINPQTLSLPSGFRIFYSFPGQPASYVGLFDTGSGVKVVVSLVINGVQRTFVAGPALTTGSWHHVAATYDGAALILYLNGTAVGQLTGLSGPANIGGNGLLLGGYSITGGSYGFDGLVDEAAVYGQALSATQVATHFALRTLVPSATVALQLAANDPNGDGITYSATGLPPDLTLNTTTGLISGTLTLASVGTHSVTVTASDGSLSTSQSFVWTVIAP